MKRHILLIDDDKDEMLILSEAMLGAGIGCKCTWAQSVDHALSILTYIRPDIVLIDLNMPVTDGLEGIRRIRQLDSLADMPVVLYSNFIESVAREAISLGANYCIQKQAGIYALSEQLNELFLQTGIAESLP
jgi:CheY-like chemotaxis protein